LWDSAEQTWVEVDEAAISKKKVEPKTKKEVVISVLEAVLKEFRDKKNRCRRVKRDC
jgi:hypothetical protein